MDSVPQDDSSKRHNSSADLHISNNFIRTMVFTMMISMMSATMFNIILPEITQEYDLTYKQASWVSTAF
ncbi:hypothetical protein [Oceanobacillus jeddahense]|uniref:MFS transporter n=1 Tax=Oceanobacillus jeddahense TaxID=1462527 RepID=A0ABY5JPS7_9BACI|nr:hypothetical protein [Oceanobacillus jeddahense]UUI01091.1 hypothetical protein NP439_13560 [Oceanobacillus jeddahense]